MFSHRSLGFFYLLFYLTLLSLLLPVYSRLVLNSHISFPTFFILICDFLIFSIVILKFALYVLSLSFEFFFKYIFHITDMFSSLKNVLTSAIFEPPICGFQFLILLISKCTETPKKISF